MVSNEIYQDLAKWRRQWKREHPFPTAAEQLAAEDRWMNAKGFASGNWPPEEWECDDCNGTGRRRREVELQEALNAYRQ